MNPPCADWAAASGVEAVQVWEQHGRKVDLLLADLVMPDGLTGRDLAKRIQTHDRNLKVIYTSGYSPETRETTFVFLEGTNFLQKPYPPSKLAEIVRRRLDQPGPVVRSPRPPSMLNFRCSMLDVRCWMFDVGCSMLDVEFSMVDVASWLLAIGASGTPFRPSLRPFAGLNV